MTARPILRRDIVAGLCLYSADGSWLGVSTGPAEGDTVETVDETGAEPVKRRTDWRMVRIGTRSPDEVAS